MQIFYFATFELEFQIDPPFYVLNSKLLRPSGKFDLILETLVPVLILRFVRPSVFRNPFVLLLVDFLTQDIAMPFARYAPPVVSINTQWIR